MDDSDPTLNTSSASATQETQTQDPPTSTTSPPPPTNDTAADTLDPSTFDPASLEEEADIDMNMSTDPTTFPDDQVGNNTNDDLGNFGLDGANDASDPDVKMATQKDITLQEFLGKMDECGPIIPDAVTSHFLLLAGLPPHTTPLPLSRLLALATQKFIADIAADAYQYSRMRNSGSSTAAAAAANPGGGAPNATTANTNAAGNGAGAGGEQGIGGKGKLGGHVLGTQRAGYGGGGGGAGARAVLTMEDLGCAVGEYGVNVRRGEFYR
ncbi:MAG: hypothetical protein Q9220_001690 [cf. Caloplaca sp. 1 TL-2023]